LGTDLSADTIANLLCNLELTVNRVEPNAFDVGVPLFRVDLEREIDLIEEVARLNGYDAVPPTAPRMAIFANRSTRRQCLEKRLKDLLVSEGLSEAVTYSFISPTAFDKISLGSEDRRRKCIPVMNPLTEEQSVMRTTLLPGLLETASRNNNFRTPNIRLFEMRRVYFCSGDSLPEEPMFIAGLLSGANLQQGWNQTEIPIDFFDVKGIIENLMDRTKIFDVVFENKVIDSVYHPGKAAVIMHNDLLLGSLGELHPAISQCYGLDKEVFYFELDFEKLVKIASQHQKVTPPSRYPDTFRDIAMIISDETEGSAVLGAIRKNKVPDLQNVEIFDVYKGPNIPDGQKSVAVRVFYGSDERTLNDEEVNKAHQRLKENLIKQLNVVIR
jgi:phenylalanyl-tRNA synthetase beta chain